MDDKLWFKSKTFGWGWQPCSWEGWVATLVFILLIVGGTYSITDYSKEPTKSETLDIVSFVFFLTIIFIYLAYKKGEKPRWRWGKNT